MGKQKPGISAGSAGSSEGVALVCGEAHEEEDDDDRQQYPLSAVFHGCTSSASKAPGSALGWMCHRSIASTRAHA